MIDDSFLLDSIRCGICGNIYIHIGLLCFWYHKHFPLFHLFFRERQRWRCVPQPFLRHIAILLLDVDAYPAPTEHLGGHEGGAGTAEGVEDDIFIVYT